MRIPNRATPAGRLSGWIVDRVVARRAYMYADATSRHDPPVFEVQPGPGHRTPTTTFYLESPHGKSHGIKVYFEGRKKQC